MGEKLAHVMDFLRDKTGRPIGSSCTEVISRIVHSNCEGEVEVTVESAVYRKGNLCSECSKLSLAHLRKELDSSKLKVSVENKDGCDRTLVYVFTRAAEAVWFMDECMCSSSLWFCSRHANIPRERGDLTRKMTLRFADFSVVYRYVRK